ncbi:MAG: aspartate kinase [Bacteroidota bacterium]
MKVLKFGGTSVGLPSRMHKVAQLVTKEPASKIVVLSAVSGTTNALVSIGERLFKDEKDRALLEIKTLKNKYKVFIEELYTQNDYLVKGTEVVDSHFTTIADMLDGQFTEDRNKILLAQGELISTNLFYQYLQEQQIDSVLIPALEFMSIDRDHEPEIDRTAEKIKQFIGDVKENTVIITQGYICRNHEGEIDNLKRGGSDYTASLIGAAIRSEEVQIWTDIDGMHNNDPRIVERTFPLSALSFDEAAELAYFGAKILHPSSIIPTQKYHIPVRLKSTMNDEAQGTLISDETSSVEIKAIAAKDNITAIKIKSTRMLLAYGFLRKVFEVFEKYKTSIDMITTSEVAVSLTIDDSRCLQEIVEELENFGLVEVDQNQSIICIVGAMIAEKKGVIRKVFNSLSDIPIRMVSYGGSRNNISLLIDTNFKTQALNELNEGLF